MPEAQNSSGNLPIDTNWAITKSQRGAVVPWYLWAGVIAVTLSSVGGAWDIAWHRSIGRDTFWTPAHMCIYACALLAGFVCLWLTMQCTFAREYDLSPSSVHVFGLRAPLGVFLAGWGGIAMLISAPFDNWWHAAYGLDFKIISPPHALLILGVRAISMGMLFLILAAMNRAAESGAASPNLLRLLFLYLAGDAVASHMFFLQQYTSDVLLHQAAPYIAIGIALPGVFAALAEASRFRWAATTMACIYTYLMIGEMLLFPLFPAQPRLGPIFLRVDHLVPAKFPILLVVPALGLDLLWQKSIGWRSWVIALASGGLFVSLLVASEWPFASFLLSRASENRLFGTMYFAYNSPPDSNDRLRIFVAPEHGAVLFRGLLIAFLCSSVSFWFGILFGKWMRGVRR